MTTVVAEALAEFYIKKTLFPLEPHIPLLSAAAVQEIVVQTPYKAQILYLILIPLLAAVQGQSATVAQDAPVVLAAVAVAIHLPVELPVALEFWGKVMVAEKADGAHLANPAAVAVAQALPVAVLPTTQVLLLLTLVTAAWGHMLFPDGLLQLQLVQAAITLAVVVVALPMVEVETVV